MTAALARVVLPVLLLVAGWASAHRFLAANILLHELPEEEALIAAARWDPANPEAQFLLAVHHRDRLESLDLQRSLRHLERAVELQPASWRYRWELGRTYELVGRLAEAEEELLAAIERNPGSADHRWRLANFYLRSGELEAAGLHFRAVLAIQPRLERQALALLREGGAGEDLVGSVRLAGQGGDR